MSNPRESLTNLRRRPGPFRAFLLLLPVFLVLPFLTPSHLEAQRVSDLDVFATEGKTESPDSREAAPSPSSFPVEAPAPGPSAGGGYEPSDEAVLVTGLFGGLVGMGLGGLAGGLLWGSVCDSPYCGLRGVELGVVAGGVGGFILASRLHRLHPPTPPGRDCDCEEEEAR